MVLMEERSIIIRCPDCGDTRKIGARQNRRVKNQEADDRCSLCRSFKHPAKIEQKHRNYWTSRYSDEWIKKTAEMIWSDGE